MVELVGGEDGGRTHPLHRPNLTTIALRTDPDVVAPEITDLAVLVSDRNGVHPEVLVPSDLIVLDCCGS